MTRIAIHAILPRTETNGPGLRFGIWVQGCSKSCRGCFNPKALPQLGEDSPEFTPPAGSGWMKVDALLKWIREEKNKSAIEGISISGGEPFDQPGSLKEICAGVRQLGLSVLIFTGYTMSELMSNVETVPFFEPEPIVDVLVDGLFEIENPVEGELRGSTNQEIRILTGRYKPGDLIPPGPIEVIIQADGTISATGFTRAPLK